MNSYILSSSCSKKDDNNNNPSATTVTDKDGNVYHTVTIGTQVWMVENLKTTKYNDGSSIPLAIYNNFGGLITPGYEWYKDDAANKNIYGALYNWSINLGLLAPTGWHIPSDAEWNILITYLGGYSVAGDKLREKGTAHWDSPNEGATNASGFTALPGGCRQGMNFDMIGGNGFWWSSTKFGSDYVWYMQMAHGFSGVNRDKTWEESAMSVRCLRN